MAAVAAVGSPSGRGGWGQFGGNATAPEIGDTSSDPPGDACRRRNADVSIRKRLGLPSAGTMGGTIRGGDEANSGRERLADDGSFARSPSVTLTN